MLDSSGSAKPCKLRNVLPDRDHRWILELGDCLEVLVKLPENSVHALVCDPPAGIAFMGAEWDSDRGGRASWVSWLHARMTQAMRVMKPGAFGLVWAFPATQHWTMCALEDAGFWIHDVVMHLFGQGWPKTMDISKAIDKKAGAERTIVGQRKRPDGGDFVTTTAGARADSGYERPWMNDPVAVKEKSMLTAPATEDAKRWQGWGTALKPSFEPWILVQKPFKGTIVDNVRTHGVGGLNIDECRIPCTEGRSPSVNRRESALKAGKRPRSAGDGGIEDRTTFERYIEQRTGESFGRYPTNTIVSHNPDCTEKACTFGCAVVMLDRQAGVRKSGALRAGTPRKKQGHNTYGTPSGDRTNVDLEASEGSASRFFYCPKAKSKSSRGGEGNTHPTVKHPALMEYLCKLITPPDGIVLDPFAGSGTTGVAALRSGFRFIGVEREQKHIDIARRRLENGE